MHSEIDGTDEPGHKEPNRSRPKTRPVPLSKLPRTLVNHRWRWTTILVLVGILVLARLGVWQLDRLEGRRAHNAEYLRQIAGPTLLLGQDHLLTDPAQFRDRTAEARGRYDFSRQLILTQQNYEGRPGVHLITPLQIAEGNVAVLVNRGWIPAAEAEAGDLTRFDEAGDQSVGGAIQLSQTLSGDRDTGVDSPKQIWYRIDINEIRKQMPYELLPFYLLESPPAGIQENLPYRTEPDIDLSDGPHLGYAIQWFLFAAILTIGYVRYVSVHEKTQKRND